MITLLTVLTIILAAALVIGVLTLVTGGTLLLIFGDLIIGIAVIILIVKLFRKGKK